MGLTDRHIPIGVLFDLLVAEPERPWNLTVNISDDLVFFFSFLNPGGDFNPPS